MSASVRSVCGLALLCSCGGESVRFVDAGADSDVDADTDADADSDGDCNPAVETEPPAAPSILDPASGRIDVVPDQLVIRASAFSDPDGDAHAESEAEIWIAPGGERLERVWQATNQERLTEFILADGEFEGLAAGVGLAEWADHVVRVRYRDDTGSCDAWSAWSDERLFRTDDGSSHFFGNEVVRRFDIEIPPSSWDDINSEAYPGGCVQYRRNYYMGALVYEGERFDGVGVRLKGGCGSSRNLDGKSSFKINLNWDDPDVPGCPEERRLHGLSRFTLNNGVQDWTQEHEALGYAVYREMDVPSPRVGHAQVYVNGVYYGVYVHVETIDRRFLRRWFENNDGMMYEGAYWCDLLPWNVPNDLDEWSCFDREFSEDVCDEPDPDAEPTDWELLRQLTLDIQDIPPGGFYGQQGDITEIFDFDRFLSMWAVDGMLAHWDAYSFHILNNYRVYHDPDSGLWTMMPWGIDQTFRGDLDPWSTDAVIIRRCLQETDCEDAFAQRLQEVSDTYESMELQADAQRMYDVVAPLLRDDPRKEYDNGAYGAAYRELVDFIPWRPLRVGEILASHGF